MKNKSTKLVIFCTKREVALGYPFPCWGREPMVCTRASVSPNLSIWEAFGRSRRKEKSLLPYSLRRTRQKTSWLPLHTVNESQLTYWVVNNVSLQFLQIFEKQKSVCRICNLDLEPIAKLICMLDLACCVFLFFLNSNSHFNCEMQGILVPCCSPYSCAWTHTVSFSKNPGFSAWSASRSSFDVRFPVPSV